MNFFAEAAMPFYIGTLCFWVLQILSFPNLTLICGISLFLRWWWPVMWYRFRSCLFFHFEFHGELLLSGPCTVFCVFKFFRVDARWKQKFLIIALGRRSFKRWVPAVCSRDCPWIVRGGVFYRKARNSHGIATEFIKFVFRTIEGVHVMEFQCIEMILVRRLVCLSWKSFLLHGVIVIKHLFFQLFLLKLFDFVHFLFYVRLILLGPSVRKCPWDFNSHIIRMKGLWILLLLVRLFI
mmetsp:Transcript_13282/g.25978  ORF Transcript_13282/g.25978 Transcript_13282/m.25978 type:complete len:237 (+) Transcript_13282:2314-3024(+)